VLPRASTLDPFSALLRDCGVVSPAASRPAKPAWARPEALAFAGVLVVLVLAVYFPALRGGFLWDDDAHVTRPALRSIHGLWRIWFEARATQQYYPVLHTAFWVEHKLWGDSVVGYHLLNALLHAGAAWLLFLVLGRLSFPAPRLAALLFALHPVCVESVAWISEQKNTLSAVFYLGSALVYLRFDETQRRSLYAWASVLFVVALLTKSVTATLPAALLVVFWWQRGRISWTRDVVPLLPWFAVGVGSGLFTAWVERKLIGAEGADFSFSEVQRLLLAGRATVFYMGRLAWPANLMFIYPRWSLDEGVIWGCLSLLGVAILLAALVLRSRKARGPLAGFLLFAGTLFPVLGFVNVYPFLFSFVADHFQYLASIGILVPAAWGLWWVFGRISRDKPGLGVLVLAVPAVLGVVSFWHARDYRSSDTLYRATLERNPAAWLIHFNLAVTLGMGPEHLSEAISEYEATVKLKPDHWRAHNNLASALLRVPGRTADAVAEYREALRYNPDYADAHNNLALALESDPSRLPEAERELRTAIRINPNYDAAHSNLGSLLMRNPDTINEAISEYEAAIEISPDDAGYHFALANALSLIPGKLADAVLEYRVALQLRPGYVEAHSNLGVALAHTPGGIDDAIEELKVAAGLSPGSANVHANLANALTKVPGRNAEAISEYAAALRINPSDALSHYSLGMLLSREPGRLQDAIPELEAAVRLSPSLPEAHYGLAIDLAMYGGRRTDAIRQLQEALALRPDFPLARQALERLQAESP
jgi:protein O-mannosyl-transferase